MSRAQVAQAFMESAENQQNADGFVTGWGALRAAGNPGPTTAQLDNFSDTATTAEIIASADTVGTSTTAFPAGSGGLALRSFRYRRQFMATDPRLLNGATTITATDPVTINQLAAIDAITTGTLTAASADTGPTWRRTRRPTRVRCTYVTGATNVTVEGIATLAQLTAIDAATAGALTYTAVTGSATDLAASTYVTGRHRRHGGGCRDPRPAGGYRRCDRRRADLHGGERLGHRPGGLDLRDRAATNVTVTGSATIAQLQAIDAEHHRRADLYGGEPAWPPTWQPGGSDLRDGDADQRHGGGCRDPRPAGGYRRCDHRHADLHGGERLGHRPGGLDLRDGATNVTVTGSATIAQLQAIDANTTGTLTYTAVSGTAAALAAAPVLLNGATDITATDAATVLQAGIIEAATNDGTNTYNITDTPTNLAASTNEVFSLAGTVTASVPRRRRRRPRSLVSPSP